MSNSGGLIRSSAPLNTGKLISSYYLEIDYLLERVEGATTHYQTLGVERAATTDEVILAYQKSVAVLHPSYHKVRAAVPDEMLVRVDQAFKKVSQAFSVLTDSSKRTQYDEQRSPPCIRYSSARFTQNQSSATLQINATDANQNLHSQKRKRAKNERAKTETVDINIAQEMRPVFTRTAVQQGTVERRRCERFKLTVPVLVAGYEHTGKKVAGGHQDHRCKPHRCRRSDAQRRQTRHRSSYNVAAADQTAKPRVFGSRL